ncbi:hypothetical protein PCANC_23020, partial [Puccinia coronata f. sp. avenae]
MTLPDKKADSPPINKTLLHFIMNRLTLGDHAKDIAMEQQELVVDTVLQECSLFAATVPKTYLQAQR